MHSRSLIKRSSKSELIRLMMWKTLGETGMRLFRKKPLDKAPDMSQTTAIFICGLHRSGTSVLHRILRKLPNIASFENTGVPEDEGQHLQTVFPSARRLGGPGQFAFDPSAHLVESTSPEIDDKRELLLREWGAYIDFTKPFFLEKSPPNIVRTRLFQSFFPNSKFIIITRHPISVAMATSEKWNIDLERCVEHWAVAHKIFLKDQARLKNCKIISYEQLCATPHQCLKDIGGFLGIKIDGNIEDIRNLNAEYFERWRSLPHAKKASVSAELQDEVKPILTPLGYEHWNEFEAFSGKAV